MISFQLSSMTTGPAGLRCVQAYKLFSPIGDTNVSEDPSTLSTSHWYSRASWSGSRSRRQPCASSLSAYAQGRPLDAHGCRLLRLPLQDALLYQWLVDNVEGSSDTFVSPIGLNRDRKSVV